MGQTLEGKVAIVTGAARGIGAATSRILAREGAKVVLGDVNIEGIEAIAGELGPAAVACHADVTRERDIERLVSRALDSFGRLDILHNNAVTLVPDDLDVISATDGAWQQTFEFVVMAAVWGARHAIPAMLAGGDGGSIISTSSAASHKASATKAAYGSCKAALETFSLYVGSQYGDKGIRSNVVRPGLVLTEGIREVLNEEILQKLADTAIPGRVCGPEDVGEVVAFLASPAAGYVNCQVVDVNGGGVKPATSW